MAAGPTGLRQQACQRAEDGNPLDMCATLSYHATDEECDV